MTSDNNEPTNFSSRLTDKQKKIAAVLVIVIGFVCWQLYSMLKNSNEAPAITPPASTVASGKTLNSPPMNLPMAPKQNPNVVQNTPTIVQQPQLLPKTGQQMIANADIIKDQQEEQKEYLARVNQLQMLKMQKDIAETNQAIAAAKLATATAEKNISDLLTRTAPVQTAVDYAGKLLAPGPIISGQSSPPVGEAPSASYVVISVAMQLGRWTAVLGYQGKLYSVNVGDVLPPDGSTVLSISREGIVLKKGDVKKKISLVPVV